MSPSNNISKFLIVAPISSLSKRTRLYKLAVFLHTNNIKSIVHIGWERIKGERKEIELGFKIDKKIIQTGGGYGGSKIKVEFLGRKSQKKWTNVHVLWDSDLIDDYKMSYTEYANSLLSYKTVDFKQGDIEVWTNESHQHAKKIYSELRGGELLGFDYVYENLPIVNDRLYRAGIRLANILNSIFG